MGEPTDYQVPPPETVQELAKLARCAFTLETRENGSEYWIANRCAPDWIGELVRTAHGDMFPDDYRYAFIVEALDALEEAEGTADDWIDEARYSYEFEPYHSRLSDWLGSSVHRFYYCDDWAKENPNPEIGGTVELLQGGHLYERLEVLHSVCASLEAHLATLAAA
jgi:hypothetical protein